MTLVHRQTQNMSDLTSDRVPLLFWTQKIGGITRNGSQSQDISVVMLTTREAQLVQLWTKPDTIRDHKPLWCFLVLDYQGFPFLSNCCISHETMRLCPKSLRVSCPVWHKHSAFFLYLQKQLPPHCVLSSMECVFGSHFSFAAATHFWAFVGMVGVLGVMLTRCEMKKYQCDTQILLCQYGDT